MPICLAILAIVGRGTLNTMPTPRSRASALRLPLLARRDFEPQGSDRLADVGEDRAATVAYNVELLEEAGLVEARILKVFSTPDDFILIRLTWSGHEFLDAIRSDTVWNKTKQTIGSKGLSMTFELVKSVAVKIATELILPSP